jgi:hypothetical protein
MAAQALEGDVQAANLVLQRIHPTLKSKAPTFVFDLDPDAPLETQARQVVAAAAEGLLDAETARGLVDLIHSLATLKVADELLQLEHRPPALPATVVHMAPESNEGTHSV